MRVQSRAFFAFTFLSTLRHWFQFIFDDLLGFTYLCFHIYIYTICKRFTTSPFMIIDMFTMNQMFSPTSDLNHPNPSSLVDPALEWSRSLFGSQGSGAWNWHHVSSKSLPQLQQMMMFHKQIECEDWMGWTCSHMKVEVNGAWQKLSTWHAARKPDWQAEGRAENWVMQTYGPVWQDGNLKGRYRKFDHQFGLQLFIVRTKCKCWPTGSVGRRHKNQPRVQVALAYKIYARLVRGDRRMTPDTSRVI